MRYERHAGYGLLQSRTDATGNAGNCKRKAVLCTQLCAEWDDFTSRKSSSDTAFTAAAQFASSGNAAVDGSITSISALKLSPRPTRSDANLPS